MLVILGICIEIEKLSGGKRSVSIQIFSCEIVDWGPFSFLIVTRWRRWRPEPRWCQIWYKLLVSAWRRCTHSFASSVCLQILSGASLSSKASVRLVLKKHSRVSMYCSPQLLMPRKLNYLLRLFLDFGATNLDQVLSLPYCGAQKPSYGHFGHMQCQVPVRLF